MTSATEKHGFMLKPCPICGYEADFWNTPHVGGLHDCVVLDSFGFAVECTNCGLTTRGYFSMSDAAEAWNARTATNDEDFGRAVHDGSLWRRIKGRIRCNHCGLNIESVIALDGCNKHAIKHCPNCGKEVTR